MARKYRKGNGGDKYSGRNRWNNYYNGYSQLKKDVYMLKSLINVEKKFIDTTVTNQVVSTTPVLTLLNGIAQGTNLTDRVGNSFKMMSLSFDGFVTLGSASTFDYVRVAFILDRQANGLAPTYQDIYEANTPVAQRNKLSVDRFLVMKEFNIDLDANGKAINKFKYYSKLPLSDTDRHVKNNGTGATIASIYSNSVYMVVCGGNTVGATTQSSLSINPRIRFVDN